MEHNEVEVTTEVEQKRNPFSELVYIMVTGAFILTCFLLALGYTTVSARAPLVVMTPLIILMVILSIRLIKLTTKEDVKRFNVDFFKGRNEVYKKITTSVISMILLSLGIFILGHYVAIFLFIFVLLRFISKETLKLSISVAAVTTILLFGLFEYVFSIHLYRGLIFRYFMGYDVF